MFNSGEEGHPLLTTFKGGTGNGLEIMLDIQQDEYLPIWGETGKELLFLTITKFPFPAAQPSQMVMHNH